MIIGEKIKNLRKNNNMSQNELAKKLNITHSAISKYESGIVPIPIENLKAVANIFGVTADYLLGINDKKQIAACTKDNIDISELPESDKLIIKSIIDSFKNRK